MKLWHRPPAQRDPNPAASMALLDQVLDPPLGPGYYSAAKAREEAGMPASPGLNTLLMFVITLIFGFLLTVAAVALRAPDSAAGEVRADLINRIEAAQLAGDEQSQRVEALRADILALEQEQARAGSGGVGERDVTDAGLRAGAVAVHGPGVVVTLNDGPGAPAEPGAPSKPARVNARDLQLVTNGLWAAGAEAISINGHRLTSTSAIRYAGEAIIVDFRGLTPPYEIKAIGDPEQLRAETSVGVTGAYLAELRKQLGMKTDVASSDDISIGAAERLTTRLGRVPTDSSTKENG